MAIQKTEKHLPEENICAEEYLRGVKLHDASAMTDSQYIRMLTRLSYEADRKVFRK